MIKACILHWTFITATLFVVWDTIGSVQMNSTCGPFVARTHFHINMQFISMYSLMYLLSRTFTYLSLFQIKFHFKRKQRVPNFLSVIRVILLYKIKCGVFIYKYRLKRLWLCASLTGRPIWKVVGILRRMAGSMSCGLFVAPITITCNHKNSILFILIEHLNTK